MFFFFSSRRRHTRWPRDWSSDVCSSDLARLAREFHTVAKDIPYFHASYRQEFPCKPGNYTIANIQGNGQYVGTVLSVRSTRSEERRVGKECRAEDVRVVWNKNLESMMDVLCFFFFQAEDGIRDGHVTGVQTCALPILPGLQGNSIP